MDKVQFESLFDSIYCDGWAQDKKELWGIVSHLEKIQPKTVLEIGTQGGQSLLVWDVVVGQGGQLYGIDLSDCTRGSIYNNPLTMILGRSESPEIIAQVKNLVGEVDFLYIDGEHIGENPRLDWENYRPLVRKGGIVGFHDLHMIDVARVWETISYPKEHVEGIFGTGVVFI